jgi:hypothetical protein
METHPEFRFLLCRVANCFTYAETVCYHLLESHRKAISTCDCIRAVPVSLLTMCTVDGTFAQK